MPRSYTKDDEPVGGYRLVKFLGRGGFGEVWKASAPGGTEAAMKIINLGDKQGLKEFRAIRLVKSIRHPNLVPINAFWLKDEYGNFLGEGSDSINLQAREVVLLIAMGLGDKNLSDRLKECTNEGSPGIPAEELLGYMEESAKAIDFLNQPSHDLGQGPVSSIQHCDIKPQNILLVGGSAQVCDFGLARVLDDSKKTSSAAGTYAYIAPELLQDTKPSKSSDQYSLAISYYELRTGNLPFTVTSMYELMFVHLEGKQDYSKVSSDEQQVLRKATAPDPSNRYGSAVEFVKALRRAVEGVSSGSRDRGRAEPVKSSELLRQGVEIVPGYKLVRLLGKGGYGEVWEARAPGGKPAALKIIGNVDSTQGKQEFKALELIKNVDHEFLLELNAYWLLDNTGEVIPDEVRSLPDAPVPTMLVIATKLASKNLFQHMQDYQKSYPQYGGIPLDRLLPYMRQSALAIDYLNAPQHLLGDRPVSIQHRDIKPQNILVVGNGVKVGDFGLAKVVEGTSAVIHGDSQGLTLHYAAPEMFQNKVTAWSDQYSLAVTYVHLRTGKLPFKTSAPSEIVMTHLQGKLDLSSLADAERRVIGKATSVDPEARFQNCLEMVEALEEVCGPLEPSPALAGGALGSGAYPVIRPSGVRAVPSGVRERPGSGTPPKLDSGTSWPVFQDDPSNKESGGWSEKGNNTTANDDDDFGTAVFTPPKKSGTKPDTKPDVNPPDIHDKKTDVRPDQLMPPLRQGCSQVSSAATKVEDRRARSNPGLQG